MLRQEHTEPVLCFLPEKNRQNSLQCELQFAHFLQFLSISVFDRHHKTAICAKCSQVTHMDVYYSLLANESQNSKI